MRVKNNRIVLLICFIILVSNLNTSQATIASSSSDSLTIEGFWDTGFDSNGDSKFDTINVTLLVNVLVSDEYTFYVSLSTGIYAYNGIAAYDLDVNLSYVQLQIHTPYFYSHRLDIPLIVSIDIVDSQEGLVFSNEHYTITNFYFYSDFDTPDVWIKGNFSDQGVDTNQDGKFDMIRITFDIEVKIISEYYFEVTLISQWTIQSYHETRYEILQLGSHQISFDFNLNLFYSYHRNSTFTISKIEVFSQSFDMLDFVSNAYTTKVYRYTEFDIVQTPIVIRSNAGLRQTADVMDWEGNGTSDDPFVIEDLFISNNFPIGYGTAIQISDTSLFILISNCTLIGGNNGIFIDNSRNIQINSSFITDSAVTGIYLRDCTNIQVMYSTIQSSFNGIKVHNSFDLGIIKNHIIDHQNDGISITDSDYNDIDTNTIHFNGFAGIEIDNSSENVIINNTVLDSETGIILRDSGTNWIVRNVIRQNLKEGVFVDNSNGSGFAYNTFYANSERGLSIQKSKDLIIDRNCFSYQGSYALDLEQDTSNIEVYDNDFIFNNDNGDSQASDKGEANYFDSNYWFSNSTIYRIAGNAQNDDFNPQPAPNHINDSLTVILDYNKPSNSVDISWTHPSDILYHIVRFAILYQEASITDNWVVLQSGLLGNSFEWDVEFFPKGIYSLKVLAICEYGFFIESKSENLRIGTVTLVDVNVGFGIVLLLLIASIFLVRKRFSGV
ncbi:hypothetical protein CEE45_08255 [Candidatus Heimdallarchaeota archaeon B3_Heim]|nr:MAG: hypothetical protein CEE45_08255 [Candidatus Heimdallarchaeota archaeon B3_Heim]